jgi:hypothetical protein
MYSVILPTMWKSKEIENLIETLSTNQLIGEILVIDNDTNRTNKSILSISKVKHFPQKENIYVNPSWNLGIENSRFDKVIILNDDINLSFSFISYIELDGGMVIGLDHSCFNDESTDFEVIVSDKREWGWGCLLILNKKDWVSIPEELKIWCGDDFIFNCFKIRKKIVGLPIKGKMSETSDLEEFDDIKNKDLKIYKELYGK